MLQSYNVNDDVAYVVAVVHWPTIEVTVAAGIHLCRSVLRMCKKHHIRISDGMETKRSTMRAFSHEGKAQKGRRRDYRH